MVWMVQPKLNETLLNGNRKAARNHVLDLLNDMTQVMFKASMQAHLHLVE